MRWWCCCEALESPPRGPTTTSCQVASEQPGPLNYINIYPPPPPSSSPPPPSLTQPQLLFGSGNRSLHNLMDVATLLNVHRSGRHRILQVDAERINPQKTGTPFLRSDSIQCIQKDHPTSCSMNVAGWEGTPLCLYASWNKSHPIILPLLVACSMLCMMALVSALLAMQVESPAVLNFRHNKRVSTPCSSKAQGRQVHTPHRTVLGPLPHLLSTSKVLPAPPRTHAQFLWVYWRSLLFQKFTMQSFSFCVWQTIGSQMHRFYT